MSSLTQAEYSGLSRTAGFFSISRLFFYSAKGFKRANSRRPLGAGMKKADIYAYLEEVAWEVLRYFRVSGKRAEVHAISNREMEAIRRRLKKMPSFKGKEAEKIRRERRVNVLSFGEAVPFPWQKRASRVLGEVYVNRSFIGRGGRRGREAGARLAIHGTLHLLGYHHAGKRDTMRMEKLEDILLRRCEHVIS